MSRPRISVLMSVYNGASTVEAAVESILSQTFEALEFVIIDDGSSDDTPKLLAGFQERDPRVRVFRTENSGLTVALNYGLSQCQAPLVARQDADDRSLPERLERQLQFMEEHPDVVLLGTSALLMGDSRVPYSETITPTDDREIRKRMRKDNQFFHTSVLFRKEVADTLGGYDTAFRRSQDYEFWLRLLDAGPCANLAEPLVELNLGGGRISRAHARAQVTAVLRAKWKNRYGSVLRGAPWYLFWWPLRGYVIPPGTLHAIRARWS